MSVEPCAKAVSNIAIQFGDNDDTGSTISRSLGVAILFACIERVEPQLWLMDPPRRAIDAKAIGSGSVVGQQNLQVILIV